MPPKAKKNAPPATPKRGTHKSRRKPQPPPEIQATADLASMDERDTMREFMQMLGNLTTALAMMSSRIVSLSKARSSQWISHQSNLWQLSRQPSLGPGLGATSQPPPHRWFWCQPSLRPGMGPPPLPVPSASQIWISTSITGSSTQHWQSPMTQRERRKQGLEGELDLLIHRVSYDQLTLQLYIMLSGPMNTCTPLKDSRPCMSL